MKGATLSGWHGAYRILEQAPLLVKQQELATALCTPPPSFPSMTFGPRCVAPLVLSTWKSRLPPT